MNTVVFSSKVGLEVNGAANNIVGVHVWFPYNQALAFVDQGVMAFHTTAPQNRFTGCYIDGSRAVFTGGGLKNNIWIQGFECCADVPGVPHGIELVGPVVGPGLVFTHNIFEGGNIFASNATATPLLAGVRVDSNTFGRGGGAGTRATLTATLAGSSSHSFDFCPLLIYPVIAKVTHSLSATTGFPTSIARPTTNCTLLVEFSEPVTGFITVSVDSSSDSASFV